ncbi:MFS transporter [Amylibacter marinus]|uniref:MFS transporter n=1 Tax=Amylibacter marinus TaxID=1475483 RepID=A0ABQ5VXP0_9RHOB|nr:MFS transporter [Amylibacter marinus]GLQ36033.1 MFS transporter [Amylibacter marinus]
MGDGRARAIFLVGLLWLAGIGAALQFAKIAVPFESYRALYPDVGAGLGWLLSIISLIGIFFGLTAGVFAAQFGYQRLLVIGLVIGAVTSICQSLLPSFGIMILLRLLEGVSHLIVVVVAPTLMAQISPASIRHVTMTLWSTFFGVAFALMAWLGLPLVQEFGLGMVLFGHGVFMAGLALVVFFGFRNLDLKIKRPNTPMTQKAIWADHKVAYQQTRIFGPGIGWLFYAATFVALLALMPRLLIGQDTSFIVLLMPLLTIAVALGVVSVLLLFMRAVQVAAVGFAISAAVMGMAFLGGDVQAVLIAVFACLGLVQGASFAAVSELNQSAHHRALSNGTMAQMGNLGTPVLLFVLERMGDEGVFAVVILLYGAGALTHLRLSARTRNPKRSDSQS